MNSSDHDMSNHETHHSLQPWTTLTELVAFHQSIKTLFLFEHLQSYSRLSRPVNTPWKPVLRPVNRPWQPNKKVHENHRLCVSLCVVGVRIVGSVFICLFLLFENALWLSVWKVWTESVSREHGREGRTYIFFSHGTLGWTVCMTSKTGALPHGVIPEEIEGGRGFLIFHLFTAFSNTIQRTLYLFSVFQEILWLFETDDPLFGHIDPFFHSDCYLLPRGHCERWFMWFLCFIWTSSSTEENTTVKSFG